jgi:hypothetical protein
MTGEEFPMHLPTIATNGFAIVTLACAALACRKILQRQNGQAIFNGGILLAIGLLLTAAVPLVSHLSWADLVDEASEQAIATLHFLEVTYVILTL